MKHLAGVIHRHVVVENYHRFARGYLHYRGKMPGGSICTPQERFHFIHRALDDAKAGGDRSPNTATARGILRRRVQWIQQHGIADARSYTDAERIGRAMARVTRAERVNLFALYERYLAHRRQSEKLYDWSGSRRRGASRASLRSNRTPLPPRSNRRGPGLLAGDAALTRRSHSRKWKSDVFRRHRSADIRTPNVLGGALAWPQERSGDSRRTTETRSRLPGSRWHWRPCPSFRLTRIWWNQRLRPRTDRFRSSGDCRTSPTNDNLSFREQLSWHGPKRWPSCSGHASRKDSSEDIFREMRHGFTEVWGSGRTAPVSSTGRITPPRAWNSILCSCRSFQTQNGRIRPTSGI